MRFSSKLALALLGCSSLVLFSLASGVTGRNDPPTAVARTGTFRLAMIQVSYSDAAGHIFSLDQLRAAGDELRTFYDWLSYGNLDLQVRVGSATVGNTRRFYWNDCAPDGSDVRDPCLPPLIQDVAEAAAAGGLDFANVDGIMLVNPWCEGDWTNGPVDIDRPGVRGRFQRAYVHECNVSPGDPRVPPGDSGVWWGAWAHEIGHQLQSADGHEMIHPGGYASGYDLMDSCYPCHESVYGVTRPGGDKLVFPDWLPNSKVMTIEAPGAGTRSTEVDIAPLELRPDETTLPMGIKIPISSLDYYLVDARERRRTDTLNTGPGIWDEGIEILYVAEGASPSVIPIDACDTTEPGRCVRDVDHDPRGPDCLSIDPMPRRFPDHPAYCWPFPLFHLGQVYTDSANNITIRYVSRDGGRPSHHLTIERGLVPGRPDISITPWLTPPMNAYETIDIWVDSGCNGYESDVGARGLRYGRRADGTVIGNGDDPCANHENRVYAHVRNLGDAPAINVLVNFERTEPMGVGMWGSQRWAGIGAASPAEFPALASIPPGGAVDVYVLWTPVVDLSGMPPSGRFNFHTCIRVSVRPVVGETVFSNQDGDGEQENIDVFEAVIDFATSSAAVLERETILSNPFSSNDPPGGPRTFHMIVRNELPPGWTAIFGSGRDAYTLAPNELRRIPIRVISGPGPLVPGEFYSFHAEARTLVELTNPAIPPGLSPSGGGHMTTISIGGATYMVHVVEATDLTLDLAIDGENNLIASGKLSPPHEAVLIAIDYSDSAGNTVTRLAPTAVDGSYQDRLCPSAKGTWRAIAFWQGDLDHASATSPEKQIEVAADCAPREATPTPQSPGPTATPRPATPTFQTGPATSTPTRTPTPQSGPFIGSFTAVPNCQINTVSINWRIDNPGPNTTIQLSRNGQSIHSSNIPQGSFVDQIQKGTFQYTLTVPGVDFRTVSVNC